MLYTTMTIEPYFTDITCTHRIKSMIRISAILSQVLFVIVWIFVLSLSLRRQMGVLEYILNKNYEGITPLFLHKVSKHYNALSPLDIEYLWHLDQAHITDSCVDDVITFSKSEMIMDLQLYMMMKLPQSISSIICKSTEFLIRQIWL